MNAELNMTRDLRNVEDRLKDVLRPITPPAAFVADLREKLDLEMIKKTKTKKVRNGLLVAGGVVGLVALVITILNKLTSLDKLAASVSKNLPKIRKRQQAASI